MNQCRYHNTRQNNKQDKETKGMIKDVIFIIPKVLIVSVQIGLVVRNLYWLKKKECGKALKLSLINMMLMVIVFAIAVVQVLLQLE